MKYLDKFEGYNEDNSIDDSDYLSKLKQDSKLRKSMVDNKEHKKGESDYLSSIMNKNALNSKRNKDLEERKELTHIVIQSIIYSEQNKDGFGSFKDELRDLLSKYQLDKLPKSNIDLLNK